MGCLPHSVRDLSQVKLKLIMKHSFVNSNSLKLERVFAAVSPCRSFGSSVFPFLFSLLFFSLGAARGNL